MSDSSPQPQLVDDMPIQSRLRVRGQEHVSRVNYLYQASEEMLKVSHQLPNVAQNYGRVMTTIAEKTTAKLDFSLKRSLCKKCNSVLILGVNAIYRLKRKRAPKAPKGKSRKRRGYPTQIITCNLCGTQKKFETNPKFELKEKALGVVVATFVPSNKNTTTESK